jgi:hypothetical protein
VAVFSVEGKLGTGKTKFCIWQAQKALRQGRRVASNVDLNLDKLVPELPKAYYQRIPDKPKSVDLEAIGHGNPDSYDEEKNGVLILDELGSWLNTRSFQDKDRLPVIDWMIHARKKGWDVYLIVQDSMMIDKQVREALIEYKCRCMRLDKVKVPFIGGILGGFNPRWAYMPRMHLVAARVGDGPGAIVAERWNYRGDDLHAAYDTRQIFVSNPDDCTRTVLSPLRFGAALEKGLGLVERIRQFFRPPVLVKPVPHPIVAKLMHLPPDERIRHLQRFIQSGAV